MLSGDGDSDSSSGRIIAPTPHRTRVQHTRLLDDDEASTIMELEHEVSEEVLEDNIEEDELYEEDAFPSVPSVQRQIPLSQLHFPFNNFNIHASQIYSAATGSPSPFISRTNSRTQLLRSTNTNSQTTALETPHTNLRRHRSTRSIFSRADSYRMNVDEGAQLAFLSPPIYDQERESLFFTSRPASPVSSPSHSSLLRSKQIQIGRPSMLLIPETVISKPWLNKKDILERLSWWISISMILLGVGAAAVIIYLGAKSVPKMGNLCLVMQDDFDSFDTNHTWTRDVDMSGFGNGEFQMTTALDNNSFVSGGNLYIVPTLTSSVIGNASIFNGFTYNITGCTNANISACGAVSNATTQKVINPVMSARMSTKKSYSIQFGKVEVRAKLPTGDWMWPAIWMLPVDNRYGPWPQSGEIDIMESRGNGPEYPNQGRNYVRSTLNWGPTTWMNTGYKTYGWWDMRRSTFSKEFHTYSVEWTPEFLRMYVDSRLHRTLDLRFKKESFFQRGQFPETVYNYTSGEQVALQNPWVGRGNAAPFDQPFYLILNVAVGGTNGWFPDYVGNKPWVDGSFTAMHDFAASQDQWYSTWPAEPKDRGMAVDYVKMWKQC